MNLKAIALILVSSFFVATASAENIPEPATDFDLKMDVRYPKKMKIVPVDDSTPADLKPFAGRWAGQYNGVMNVVITFVDLQDANNIKYAHSVGITPAYNIMRKLRAYNRAPGQWDASKKKIVTKFEPTQLHQFSITKEGWLKVEYEEKGQWNSLGILKRVQDFPGQPSGATVPAPFNMAETL